MSKEFNLEHIRSRRGPLIKDWTAEKTTVYLLGIPLAEKIKQPALRELRLCGIPVYRKRLDASTITTYLFGVRVQKRENIFALAERLTAAFDETERRLNPQAYPDMAEPLLRGAQSELAVLDQLAAKRRNRG